jgi:hypothetical protein
MEDTLKLAMITPGRTALVAAATAALLGSMLVASPANATETTPTTSPAIAEATVQSLFDATDQTTHQFDGAIARQDGVDAALVDSYATGFAATGGIVRNATIDSDQIAKLHSAAVDIQSCTGKNRYDYTGLQLNVYLNSCKTNALLYVIGGGVSVIGSITAILGVTGLPAAATAALAGLLAVAGTFLGVCSSKGRGTVIHNIPPSTITWCNSQ